MNKGKVMDIAYPLRDKRPVRNDPIIWSLRTVEKHLPHGRVFVAGGLAKELDIDTITHIPVLQSHDKFTNIGNNLIAILNSDISEDFYWFNDDFFVLKDVEQIPLYVSSRVDMSIRHPGTRDTDHWHWVMGMRSQRKILEAVGWGTAPNADIHLPIPLNKTKMLDLILWLSTAHPDHAIGNFRSLYAAMIWSQGGETIKLPVVDVKTRARGDVRQNDFISTSRTTWRDMPGGWIRKEYAEPSRYERPV